MNILTQSVLAFVGPLYLNIIWNYALFSTFYGN